jgi:hypothetical protein
MSKKPHHKKGAGGVAQGVGPEFQPQHHKKKEKRNWRIRKYLETNKKQGM